MLVKIHSLTGICFCIHLLNLFHYFAGTPGGNYVVFLQWRGKLENHSDENI